jgi:acyl-CoA-binding protein
MSDLKAQFEKAAEDIKKLAERPDNDTLLKLYALYKQGAEGNVRQVRSLGQAQGHLAGRCAEEVRRPGQEADRLGVAWHAAPASAFSS